MYAYKSLYINSRSTSRSHLCIGERTTPPIFGAQSGSSFFFKKSTQVITFQLFRQKAKKAKQKQKQKQRPLGWVGRWTWDTNEKFCLMNFCKNVFSVLGPKQLEWCTSGPMAAWGWTKPAQPEHKKRCGTVFHAFKSSLRLLPQRGWHSWSENWRH